jgi:hypothetical protein
MKVPVSSRIVPREWRHGWYAGGKYADGKGMTSLVLSRVSGQLALSEKIPRRCEGGHAFSLL